MKSQRKIAITYILELNEEEASWLRGIVQNPLFDYEDLEEEPLRDKEMRLKIFDALNEETL